ncbi:MAG: hypothetical protein P8100_02865, partial [bacterium]
KKLLYLVFTCIFVLPLTGQTNGDFRSAASGDWNIAATWEIFNGSTWEPSTGEIPDATSTITIQSPHVVDITTPPNNNTWSATLIINNGATVNFQALATGAINITGNWVINGTWNGSASGSNEIQATITGSIIIGPGGVLNTSGGDVTISSTAENGLEVLGTLDMTGTAK